MSDFFLVGSFRHVPNGRGEYVGCVAKQQGKEMTVLAVGCEDTEHGILDWIKNTIALMRESGKLNVQAPDKYDRMRDTLAH